MYATEWGEGQDDQNVQGWTEEEEEEDEEVDTDYVGESCRRRGGMGHYVRECPTPRVKWKGGSGKGKAK